MSEENLSSPGFTPEEELSVENEMAALNLEMKYGAKVHVEGDAPPEILQEFLANVTVFEEQRRSGETTTVYKRIGEPKFASPDLLEPATLPGELERILEILDENGFILFRPETLDDEVFYEFIVQEVFPHEIPAVKMPNMKMCLDYEEFHPDPDTMITQAISSFLYALLNLDDPFDGEAISNVCYDDSGQISGQQALRAIADFRRAYKTIVPVGFFPEELTHEADGTYQTFGIRWEGTPLGSQKKVTHEGFGVIRLEVENGDWRIKSIDMPGFKF